MTSVAQKEAGIFVAPSRRDFDTLSASLRQWFSSRLPTATDIDLINFEYPTGSGQSHETILFDAAWTQDGVRQDRGLVVRIKPTTFTVFMDDMFVEQYRIMQVMRESGRVGIAELLWLEEDPAILGSPFFVMEKLDGRVPVSIPSYMETGWVVDATVEDRARMWRNGVCQLAAIQSIPVTAAPFLARPEEGDPFMQEWTRWSRYLDVLEQREPAPFHREVHRRLERAFPANRMEGIVWGDARLGNMMFGEDMEVLAVMDWEQPGLGGALHDLGWWMFNDRLKIIARGGDLLEGYGSRDDTIALWASETGRPVDDVDWYEAFAGFKIMCTYWSMLHLRSQPKPDVAREAMGQEILKLLEAAEEGR